METISDWHFHATNNKRTIRVLLPRSFDEQPDKRYPVVYMHDGRELLDDHMATFGHGWHVDRAANQGAQDGSIREAVYVLIDHQGAQRVAEYTLPQSGGHGDRYLEAIVKELKPEIERGLAGRLLTDPAHTAMMGSSAGGYISAVAGAWYPEVFGLIGVVSPMTYYDHKSIVYLVRGTPDAAKKLSRVYVDSGDSQNQDNEMFDDMINTSALAKLYRDLGATVHYVVGEGHEHNEWAWEQRFPSAMAYLLGAEP